jgi:hypothetical protein
MALATLPLAHIHYAAVGNGEPAITIPEAAQYVSLVCSTLPGVHLHAQYQPHPASASSPILQLLSVLLWHYMYAAASETRERLPQRRRCCPS